MFIVPPLSAISPGELGECSGEKRRCLHCFSVSILLMREGAFHPPWVIRMSGTGQSWLCSCGKMRAQWGTAHKIKMGKIFPRLLHLRAVCSKDVFTQPGPHIWVLQGKPPGSVVRPLPRNGGPLPSPLTCPHC